MSGLNPISKCIICFSGVFTDSAVVLIKCGHTFHDQCVKKWLEKNKVCPTCRARTRENEVVKLYFDTVNPDDSFAFTQPNNDDLVNQLTTQIETLKQEKRTMRTMEKEMTMELNRLSKLAEKYKKEASSIPRLQYLNQELEANLVNQAGLRETLKNYESKLKASEFYKLIKAGEVDESVWNEYVGKDGKINSQGYQVLLNKQYKLLKDKYDSQNSELQKIRKELFEERTKHKAIVSRLTKELEKAQSKLETHGEAMSPNPVLKKVMSSDEFKRRSLGFNFDDSLEIVQPTVDRVKRTANVRPTVSNNVKPKNKPFSFDNDEENMADVNTNILDDSIIMASAPLFGGRKNIKPFTTNLNDKFHVKFGKPLAYGPKKMKLSELDDSVIVLS